MTPEQMTEMLIRMRDNAANVPSAVVSGAREVARKVSAPGVQAAAGPQGEGVRVRVLSSNPRLSSRRAAARLRPAVIRSVDKAIRRAIRA